MDRALIQSLGLKRADLGLGSDFATSSAVTKTTRVIKALARAQGVQVAVGQAEHRDATGNSHDMYGILDMQAIYPTMTLGLQVCKTDWSPHITLYRGDRLPSAQLFLGEAIARREFQMWGWRHLAQYKADGKKGQRKIWVPRVQNITLEYLADTTGKVKPEMLDFLEDIFNPRPLIKK